MGALNVLLFCTFTNPISFFFFLKDSRVMVLEDIEQEGGGKCEMEREIIIDAVLLGTKGSKCCF